MCVIVYKKENQPLLNNEEIKKGFNTNPDGAGFAYKKDGIVRYQKGLMTPTDCYESMAKIPKDAEVMYHFRVTTHGGTTEELTHPFYISKDDDKLLSLSGAVSNGRIACHNGIFSLGKVEIPKGHSDTSFVFKHFLAKNSIIPSHIVGYNKVIIFDPNKETEIVNEGLWTVDKHGRLHSNSSIVGYGYKGGTYGSSYRYSRPCESCAGLSLYEKQSYVRQFNKLDINDQLRVLTGEKTIFNYLQYEDDYTAY